MAYKQKNFFEFRDSLPKGEPDKVIKGMHFDEEFAAIEDAFSKVTGDIELDGKPLPELLDEKADQADLEQEIKDRIEGDKLLQGSIDGLADDLAQEIVDRQEGDSALGERIDKLATDDLTDVSSATASKDQFLIHNGVQWVAEDFHIETELTFQGGISVPNDAAPAANNGDLYINNEDGVAGASWTGIAGRTINTANAVGWSEKNSRWYMLGDIASAAVIRVEAGTGIEVNDDKPADPVVSIDRTEVDKWYEPPINPKLTAFNKNFGTTVGTVAEGNHTHDQYLTDFTETDPTVPQHVKDITTTNISNWNTAFSWGNHATQGYLKSGDVPGVDLTGYATEVWVTNGFQPKGSYLTSADLAGYATQSWVQGQGYLTSASLNGYATESWVSTNFQPKGNYATVGDCYTKAESDAKYELKGQGGGGLPAGDWVCEGSIYAKGNITAYWTSDERKKEDIAPMPLNLIDGINPVTFKWKESGKTSGGVIAQQLQACGLDDWVNEAPDGTLGVDYMALIGVLLAEVQDLKLRVKELEQ